MKWSLVSTSPRKKELKKRRWHSAFSDQCQPCWTLNLCSWFNGIVTNNIFYEKCNKQTILKNVLLSVCIRFQFYVMNLTLFLYPSLLISLFICISRSKVFYLFLFYSSLLSLGSFILNSTETSVSYVSQIDDTQDRFVN